jgi:hypothetical protein
MAGTHYVPRKKREDTLIFMVSSTLRIYLTLLNSTIPYVTYVGTKLSHHRRPPDTIFALFLISFLADWGDKDFSGQR